MADISDVNVSNIKDLYQHLEDLSCGSTSCPRRTLRTADTYPSSDHDKSPVLKMGGSSINYCRLTEKLKSSWAAVLPRADRI